MIKVTVTIEDDGNVTEVIRSSKNPAGMALVLPILAAAFKAAAAPYAHEIPILRSAMQTLVSFFDAWRPEDFT
jgi:hypothetical protein